MTQLEKKKVRTFAVTFWNKFSSINKEPQGYLSRAFVIQPRHLMDGLDAWIWKLALVGQTLEDVISSL